MNILSGHLVLSWTLGSICVLAVLLCTCYLHAVGWGLLECTVLQAEAILGSAYIIKGALAAPLLWSVVCVCGAHLGGMQSLCC